MGDVKKVETLTMRDIDTLREMPGVRVQWPREKAWRGDDGMIYAYAYVMKNGERAKRVKVNLGTPKTA